MTSPACETCGRPASFATLVPNEIRPRRVVFSCSRRRHGRNGYHVALEEADAALEHLLSLHYKRRAGGMLAAALATSCPDIGGRAPV